MKTFAVSFLAFALIASAMTYRAAAKPRLQQTQAVPCIGLACWPTTPAMKHRPAHRENLPPVW